MIWKHHDQDVQYDQAPVVIQQEEPAYLMPTAAASYAMAELKAFQNNLMVVLAKQSMDNVALLTEHEARCLRDAPEGAPQYRQIVQGYTEAAMSLIWGGERR